MRNFLFSVFYNLAYTAFALIYLPHFILKARQEKDVRRLLCERLGIFTNKTGQSRERIWIHAVSVGEVLALRPFIEKLRKEFPSYSILLTTVTPTGQKLAKPLEDERLQVVYCPFDWSFCIRNFISYFRPRCLLLAETEVWPNLLRQMSRRAIPVFILNGRLSEKSVRYYRRFSWMFEPIFHSLFAVFAQTDVDQERFIEAGVFPQRVFVTGNMKFDSPSLGVVSKQAEVFSKKWRLRQEQLWIAGSTHLGEEEIVLDVFAGLKPLFPKLKLLIAPRHVERSEDILRLTKNGTLKAQLASEPAAKNFDILILDEMGLLSDLYSFSGIVFVGGSLVPKGGQNPIEPASHKCAILHGPHTFNFLSTYQYLGSEKAAQLVNNGDELKSRLRHLLEDEKECQELGKRAYAVVQQFRGSTEKQFQHFVRLLNLSRNERKENAECSEKLFSSSGGRL